MLFRSTRPGHRAPSIFLKKYKHIPFALLFRESQIFFVISRSRAPHLFQPRRTRFFYSSNYGTVCNCMNCSVQLYELQCAVIAQDPLLSRRSEEFHLYTAIYTCIQLQTVIRKKWQMRSRGCIDFGIICKLLLR